MNSLEDFCKPTLHIDKQIIYNKKPYPIDFSILKKYSFYFYENRKNYKNCNEINFSKEDFDVSEESFQNFISFCQIKKYQINNSNVFDLYLLSVRFIVKELNQQTKDYIVKNHSELIFQSIFFKIEMMGKKKDEIINDSDLFSLKEEEEIISSHFFEYIEDPRLLDIPVKQLYNIINNEKFSMNKLNSSQQKQFTDFLFKCLDRYQKDASILFLNLDIEKQRIDFFSRLKNEYSEIFDFFMLNPKFLLNTVTDMLNEMCLLKDEYSNVTKEHEIQSKQDEEKRQELQRNAQIEFQNIEKKYSEIQKNYEEKYQKILKEQEEQNKKYEENIQKLMKSYKDQIEQAESKRQEIVQTTTDQINELKQHLEGIIGQQKEVIEEQKNIIQSIHHDLHVLYNYDKSVFNYQQGKEFDGIMRNLTNKTGGNIHDNQTIEITSNSIHSSYEVPSNVVNYNTDNYYLSKNIKESFILFNFKNKFVRISNYSIMSYSICKSCLKNWVIEASNDGKAWTEIDKRENNSSLIGDKKINTFSIKHKDNLFYQFIRLRQTDYSWSDDGCYFGIYMMEFFGAIMV